MALIVCMRFSACSDARFCSDSNTSLVTSTPFFRPNFSAICFGRAEGVVAVPPPDGDALEARVELVDRPLQQRLGLPRQPVHRVAGDAVVDPAGRVALEQSVRHRWNDEIRPPVRLRQHAGLVALGSVEHGDAADEMLREPGGRHLVEPRPEHPFHSQADVVGRDPPIQDPVACRAVREHLGQQVVQIEYFDVALAHLQHEVVMVLLRLVHPQHVVEEKLRPVARREPLVGQAGPAHEDRPELADFAMNPKRLHDSLL
jgi:hypothetical protein